MIKIKVDSLTKIFGKRPERAIKLLNEGVPKEKIHQQTGLTIGVNRASFEVHEGEIFVIMGLSGSGKSTLIRLLNRLIKPTSGHVYIDEEDISLMNDEQLREIRRKKISMVFQRFALFPHRTVLENVEYGLEIQGMPQAERTAKALESLKMVGLESWANSLPDQLSGGMQQRVGLARALANDPDVLLMDEAFSALDPLIRKDMQDELVELQDKMKKTIIFITHDLDEALRIGDRIALMKDGSIVQIGTPEQFLMNPANDYVARFIEDVDLSRVLTAEHVMKRAEAVSLDKGPRVALQFMGDLGISSIFVVDRQKKLLGAVTAEAARKAVENSIPMEQILEKVTTTAPDTVLIDLFDTVATTSIPVAVIDQKGRLLGVLIRGAILGALAGQYEETKQGKNEVLISELTEEGGKVS